MKRLIKFFAIAGISAVIFWGGEVNSMAAFAWGDSDGGRPTYTIEEINNGALGPVGKAEENQGTYPGAIVFNSIADPALASEGVISDERYFVGAREDTGFNLGKDNIWNGNSITVEDGKIYLIRLYVHNNNPNGEDAVAEDVRVSFNIPTDSSRKVRVNGFIESSNATPAEYWDYVDFESDVPFHLEYVYGSASLENNGIGSGGGLQLSDDIVLAASGGTLIGYNELDGKIPGCYQYSAYISIRVKVVFDYGFTVKSEARLVGSENGTFDTKVDAQVGDMVEFSITYQNRDEIVHPNVTISDILPSGLEYVEGTTVLYNMEHIDGIAWDDIITESGSGVKIGQYGPGVYAKVCFMAKVVGDNMADGRNILVNGAKVQVGHVTLQSRTEVEVYSIEILKTIATLVIAFLVAVGLYKVFFKEYIGAKKP